MNQPKPNQQNNVKTKNLFSLISFVSILVCSLLVVPAIYAQNALPVQPDTQTLAPISPETQNFVLSLVTVAVAKYPWLATIIAIIGSMRLWAKPVFAALHALVDLTPSKWDDGLFNTLGIFFTENPTGKLIAFLLDWVGSVKLTPPTAKPSVVKEVD